ncbi:type III-B CRISPR module-associated protein Cmr5 [Rhodoferax sp.]|uniref:type III-B CRISPR module-associated protein Cmr5 n=1 Tax=Rhodoferax sp. TaxID=50421 RepID=UPI0026138F54|nr:type III-B CRISPR module-associated protein Cmr5 [Rhodoferax sp.]MDD2919541.1 type III-B CRISPR module-associated protein Cmr5 [Rhodoferax sp.]
MATELLAQQRARDALEQIANIVNAPGAPASYGNYLAYVKALPANIRSLGLGQSLAFALAKAEGDLDKPYGLLYSHVTGWLCKRLIFGSDATPENFMVKLTAGNQDKYLRAQIEAMAYLEWLKKFAVAKLKKPEGNAAGADE